MSGGPSPLQRSVVIQRDGIACRYCGAVLLGDLGVKNMPGITLDHRTAKMHGGSNILSNLLVSCSACNQRKSGHSAKDWPPFPSRFADAHVVAVIEHLAHGRPERWREATLGVAHGTLSIIEFPSVLRTQPMPHKTPRKKKGTPQPPKPKQDRWGDAYADRTSTGIWYDPSLLRTDPTDGATVVDMEALRLRAQRQRQSIHDDFP